MFYREVWVCALFMVSSPGFALLSSLLPDVEIETQVVKDLEIDRMSRNWGMDSLPCPLRVGDQQDLVQQLYKVRDGLKDEKCRSRHDEVFKDLQKATSAFEIVEAKKKGIDLSELDEDQLAIRPWGSFQDAGNLDARAVGSQGGYIGGFAKSRMISQSAGAIAESLNMLVTDEDCQQDMKQAGLLHTTANLATSVGQIALAVPSPSGLVAGAAAIGVGAGLNVLDVLFRSPFDWSNDKDRNQFIALNCNFYDVRHNLEKNGFFIPNDEGMKEDVQKLKIDLKNLDQQMKKIENNREDFHKQLLKAREDFMKESMGQAVYDAHKVLKILTRFLYDLQAHELQKRLEFVRMVRQNRTVLNNLMECSEERPYIPSLLDVFDQLEETKLVHMDEKSFVAYMDPIRAMLNDIYTHLQDHKKVSTRDWSERDDGDSAVPRQKVVDKIVKAYNQIEDQLSTARIELVSRIQILQLHQKNNIFSRDDAGAQQAFDVLKQYGEIRDMLFGEIGWSFFKYTFDQLRASRSEFEHGLKVWKRKFYTTLKGQPNYALSHLKPEKKAVACRDVFLLREHWVRGNASARLTWDFMQTNQGLWHSQSSRFLKVFHLPLWPFSHTWNLYNQMIAGEHAQRALHGETSKIRSRARRKAHYALAPIHRNVGYESLVFHDHHKDRVLLERVFEDSNCARYTE
ncbi:MAG: hypothetical protein AB8C84_10180 [Oligoflexales bacterium]